MLFKLAGACALMGDSGSRVHSFLLVTEDKEEKKKRQQESKKRKEEKRKKRASAPGEAGKPEIMYPTAVIRASHFAPGLPGDDWTCRPSLSSHQGLVTLTRVQAMYASRNKGDGKLDSRELTEEK